MLAQSVTKKLLDYLVYIESYTRWPLSASIASAFVMTHDGQPVTLNMKALGTLRAVLNFFPSRAFVEVGLNVLRSLIDDGKKGIWTVTWWDGLSAALPLYLLIEKLTKFRQSWSRSRTRKWRLTFMLILSDVMTARGRDFLIFPSRPRFYLVSWLNRKAYLAFSPSSITSQIMEFIAGPAVHRVLCADCGTIPQCPHFVSHLLFPLSRYTHRTKFCEPMCCLLEKYVSPQIISFAVF